MSRSSRRLAIKSIPGANPHIDRLHVQKEKIPDCRTSRISDSSNPIRRNTDYQSSETVPWRPRALQQPIRHQQPKLVVLDLPLPDTNHQTRNSKKKNTRCVSFFSCLCFPSLEGHRLGTQPSPLHKSETSKILCKTRAVETAERELRTPSAHESSKHSE
jgi:hypothetical protein